MDKKTIKSGSIGVGATICIVTVALLLDRNIVGRGNDKSEQTSDCSPKVSSRRELGHDLNAPRRTKLIHRRDDANREAVTLENELEIEWSKLTALYPEIPFLRATQEQFKSWHRKGDAAERERVLLQWMRNSENGLQALEAYREQSLSEAVFYMKQDGNWTRSIEKYLSWIGDENQKLLIGDPNGIQAARTTFEGVKPWQKPVFSLDGGTVARILEGTQPPPPADESVWKSIPDEVRDYMDDAIGRRVAHDCAEFWLNAIKTERITRLESQLQAARVAAWEASQSLSDANN